MHICTSLWELSKPDLNVMCPTSRIYIGDISEYEMEDPNIRALAYHCSEIKQVPDASHHSYSR
jgi:hypothetical protein